MTPTYTSESPETTPRGVKLLSALFVINAPLIAFQGFSVFGKGVSNTLYGGVLFLISIASLAIAYGLWTRALWGYLLGFFNYGSALLVYLLTYNIIGVLVVILILYYLYNQRDHYF